MRALQRVAVAARITGTAQPEFGAEGKARPRPSELIHTGKRGPVNMIPFTAELPDFRRRRQGALEFSRQHRVALRPRDRTGLCAAVLTPSAAPCRRRPGCGRRRVRHPVSHRPCSQRCAFCSCDSSIRGCLPHDLSPASPIPQPLPSSGRSAKGARPLTAFGKPLLLTAFKVILKPLPRPSRAGPQVRPATPPAARRDALPSRCSPHSPRPCPGGVELLLAVSAPALPHRLTPARPAVPAGSFLRRGASSPPPLPSTRDSVTDAHLLEDSLPHDATSSTRPESFFSDSEGCSADGGQ